MYTLKRFGSLMLMMTIVLSLLFTGCNSDDSKTSDDGNNKEIIELQTYFLAPTCKDTKLVEDEINKILEKEIGAKVKLNYFDWASYKDKQQLRLNSGQVSDVEFSPKWWGFDNYVAKKAFLELDELLEKEGADIKANIYPAYLEAPKFDGKLYGIPTNKDMTGVGGILLNKELVDKYGFDLDSVKTPRDLEPMFDVIKEKEPGITPFVTSKGDHAHYFMFNFYETIIQPEIPIGQKKTDGAPKILNLIETPEYKEIITMTREWYKKGYLNKDAATIKDIMPFKTNKKAFAWGEQLKPGKAEEMAAQLGYDLIQLVPYENIKPYATTADLTNSMLAIPRTSKNPEKAMAFINMLFKSKEVKNLLSWGIEGKHYKKVNDNQIDFADGVTAETSGYTGLVQWSMGGNQFLDYLWVTEKPDKWEKMKEFNDSAIISQTVGWTFNQESVKTEIASLVATGKDYGEPLGSGIVDFDVQQPKFMEALKAGNIDKVIEEVQKQADEFLANK